jgi:flagellar biosynthetic protein FliR
MTWYELISEEYVFSFFLLFTRITAMFATMPFFSHQSISIQVKAAFAFYLSIILFPFVDTTQVNLEFSAIMLALFSEIVLAVIAGLALTIVFMILMYAAEIMSFIMGFSMASAMDPATGTNSTLIGTFLSLVALLVLLQINGHHTILIFMSESINEIPLGGFIMTDDIMRYFMDAMRNFFIMGFSIAFPLIALAYISDVIFGMLMKTMPQFNLLVVGFPIKITVSLIIMIVTLGSMMTVFRSELEKAFRFLEAILV